MSVHVVGGQSARVHSTGSLCGYRERRAATCRLPVVHAGLANFLPICL